MNEELLPGKRGEELDTLPRQELIRPPRNSYFQVISRLIKRPFRAYSRLVRRFAVVTSTLALIFGVTGTLMSVEPYLNYIDSDPANDGYVQPRNIGTLVELVQASTVTIYCDITKEEGSQGSGWVIDLTSSQPDKYPTAIITNYHVIDECLNGAGTIAVKTLGGDENPGVIDRLDQENDLAVILTSAKLKPLAMSEWIPYQGYWVMAVGTAVGYEGSIAFGNVLNITETDVLITAPISHGNSGGPLVDNEGRVIGTNSWGAEGEQYNGAKSLDAMCAKIIKCKGDTYWEWD